MSSPVNPYRPPEATVLDMREPRGELHFRLPGVRVEAGRGASWIGEGWTLFTAAPVMWIVLLLLFFAISFVIGLVPVLGNVGGVLLGPVFAVGIMSFAQGLAAGEEADIGRFFTGFREKLGPLVAVGALYMVMLIALFAITGVLAFVVLGGVSLASMADPEQAAQALLAGGLGLGLLLVVLVFFLLFALIVSAYWYAPGLVFFAGAGVMEAFGESLKASLRNWLPLLVYGLLALFVLLLGTLAVFVGLLVAMPVLMGGYYASFRDIFGADT